MRRHKYLIIGGGMTAAAACGGIREADGRGDIGMISAETHRPYDRPPLSKGLWKDKQVESIWRKIDEAGVSVYLGRVARALDVSRKIVSDDQGIEYTYEKLLLATGCTPRRLGFGGDDIIYFRTLDDYQRLRSLCGEGRRFLVIGGGFIGSEIAAALAMNKQHVTLAFPEAAIGGRMYPAELAMFLNDYYREKGVEVLAETRVTGCEKRAGKTVVTLAGRAATDERAVDGVVAGIGVVPNVELAQAAGLAVDNGIRVDRNLRTNQADVYCAGDAANFYNPALNERLRVEHEDNANTMGRAAGLAMTGRGEPYDHLPFFYSDLFEMGYEAVGQVDSRLETVADWKEPLREGVVYYLQEGRVRGALLWNIFGKVDEARALIAQGKSFGAGELKGVIAP